MKLEHNKYLVATVPTMSKVTDVKVIDRSPKAKDPEVRKLLPTVLKPQRYEFTIVGVDNAIANAIRRVLCLELPVKALVCNYEDIETDDAHVIPEVIMKRLRMIPLLQSCPAAATFSLNATAGADVTDVKTAEIKPAKGGPMFNDTITLLSLQPGRSIKIKNIRVQTLPGTGLGDGMHATAFNVVSLPIDIDPAKMSSRVANPRDFMIGFNTNGTIDGKVAFKMACENIIGRLDNLIKGASLEVTSNSDEYHVLIPNETHTIGNLLMRFLSRNHTCTYSTNDLGCKFVIQTDSIDGLIADTARHLKTVFAALAEM